MIVDEIDGTADFDALKPDWDSVYEADDQAPVFLSWAWLRAYADACDSKYLILALRPDLSSRYVAFLPFTIKVNTVCGILVRRRLFMAGNPLADYTGMLCVPQYEDAAVVAFARHLHNQMRWHTLHMDDLPEDRFRQFLSYFRSKRFRITNVATTSCPYITLPSDWETYLQTCLETRGRQRLRRYMRLVESLPGFHTVLADSENVTSLIKTLLDFYCERWSGSGDAAQRRRLFGKLLYGCFETHCLWLAVQQQGQISIAALAGFVDHKKRAFSFYMMGWNPAFASLSPGRGIIEYSIRYAIEKGFSIYDFLRGDEPYKFSFGAEERFTRNYAIARPGIGAALQRLSELKWDASQKGLVNAAHAFGLRLLHRVMEINRVRVYRADVVSQSKAWPEGPGGSCFSRNCPGTLNRC